MGSCWVPMARIWRRCSRQSKSLNRKVSLLSKHFLDISIYMHDKKVDIISFDCTLHFLGFAFVYVKKIKKLFFFLGGNGVQLLLVMHQDCLPSHRKETYVSLLWNPYPNPKTFFCWSGLSGVQFGQRGFWTSMSAPPEALRSLPRVSRHLPGRWRQFWHNASHRQVTPEYKAAFFILFF